jgi:hypothetical protein
VRGNVIVLVLIAVCLLGISLQSYKVDRQAEQINEIIDAQTPLVFAFENTGPPGQPKVTFVVTCDLNKEGTRYLCTTEQIK